MRLHRRSFFQALASAFSLPALPAALPNPSAVDQIMRDVRPNQQIRYGSWKLLWTGWKPIPTQLEHCAQWVAFPVNSEGELDLSKRNPLYSATPGGYGDFRHGDMFDCDIRLYQRVYTGIVEMAPDGGAYIIRNEQETALRILLEIIHQNPKLKASRVFQSYVNIQEPAIVSRLKQYGPEPHPLAAEYDKWMLRSRV